MKTSSARSRSTANKITKAPTRVSSRIAAKNISNIKLERNTRQESKSNTKKNTKNRSPRSPTKNPKKNIDKVINQMKEEAKNQKREFELNESLRDNPMTSRNNQKTYKFSKSQIDSYKCQMQFEELNIDFYPSAIRAIENSDNDLAIKALHNVQKLQNYKFAY
ncbi:hypothetical protein BCR32DRAFT_330568 [Anaeromyces robustus]|uniref:Uncharacterized protein n=1 Tax=Anaeromyces robustus TaxID=1754192 RepID=A0A1Y1VTI6_9FUNG|nr:hypothetical protein BCR32DRAFT_330568 [Anaeromyces robustus]|eukprot:ORX64597.1 hypothetical protein BCR32DRAFT_330568 [Anaeromyces robustus]